MDYDVIMTPFLTNLRDRDFQEKSFNREKKKAEPYFFADKTTLHIQNTKYSTVFFTSTTTPLFQLNSIIYYVYKKFVERLWFLLSSFRKMENWSQRLENIDRKFTAAYDKSPKFDLLGKSSDELSKIEKASFHRDLVRVFCKKW